MFGSTILEVAIGLAFIYTLLSLVCSMVREAIESAVKSRASDLELAIRNLLASPDAAIGGLAFLVRGLIPRKLVSTTTDGKSGASTLFYKHPLVKSLYSGAYGPSYVPTPTFVAALIDIVSRPDPAALPKSLSVAEIMTAVQKNTAIPSGLKEAVLALGAQANDDVEKLRTLIGQWYEGAMDRVSGWYKRRTQVILLLVGIVVAVLTNADTLATVRALATDQSVRQSLVAQAEAYAKLSEEERAKLAPGAGFNSINEVSAKFRGMGLPFGWDFACEAQTASTPAESRKADCWPGDKPAWSTALQLHWLGWLLTAFAMTLGAPFWFDLLNKIMVIRSTVKPKEKSGEEGSEDRRNAPKPSTDDAGKE